MVWVNNPSEQFGCEVMTSPKRELKRKEQVVAEKKSCLKFKNLKLSSEKEELAIKRFKKTHRGDQLLS